MTIAKKAVLQERAIFTICPYEDGWAVEHNGEFSDASRDKDEVRASAHRRARAAHDAGRPCQVTVRGESGFFGAGAR